MSAHTQFGLKVFVSYTQEFADFPTGNSFIKKTKEAIERFGHHCVEMGAFSAQSTRPEDYDASRVKECDVYLGILGMKYGSLTSKNISHTEHEYDTAFQENKIRFIFILDPDSTENGLSVKALTPGENGYRQEAFKEKVKREAIIKFFKTSEDLYSLICDAFYDLRQITDAWIWPRQWDFSPYRAQRCAGFKGRNWLFSKVQAWAKDPNAGRALLLRSGYGVGKTAFLARVIDTKDTGLPLAAQHFCQGGINDTLSPGVFVSSVAAQLADALPAYKIELQRREARDLRLLLDDASQKPVEAWDQAVVAPLHRIPKPDLDHLLVVDALDVAMEHRPAAGEKEGVTIVDLLAHEPFPPRWLRILASSRKSDDVGKKLQIRFSFQEIGENEPKNLKDLKDYAKARCQSTLLKKKLLQAGLKVEQVVTCLCSWEQSSGKFLYVESMLNAIEANLIPLNNIDDLQALPPGMDGFYRLAFDECASKVSIHSVLEILELLCETREPLELGTLALIIGYTRDEIRRTLQPMHTLLRWEKYKVKRGGKTLQEELLGFDHVSLPQWLSQEDSAPYNIDPVNAREKFCLWVKAEVNKGQAHKSSYLARHLGGHLSDEERTKIMAGLLRSFEWIQARLQHTSINQLLSDSRASENGDDDLLLRMLNRALGQSEQILRSDANQLAPQLLARLDEACAAEGIADLCKRVRELSEAADLMIPLNPSLFKPLLSRTDSQFIPIKGLKETRETIELDIKITCLCLTRNNDILLLGCDDGSVWAWNLSLGSIRSTGESQDEKSHKGNVCSIVQISEDKVASASWDNSIIIWSISESDKARLSEKPSDLKFVKKLEGHKMEIIALLATQVGHKSYLVSASDDQTIRRWDGDTYNSTIIADYSRINTDRSTEIVGLISLGGPQVACLLNDGNIDLLNIVSRQRNRNDMLIEYHHKMKIEAKPIKQLQVINYGVNKHSLHVTLNSGDQLSHNSYIVNVKDLDLKPSPIPHGSTGTLLSLKKGVICYSLENDPAIYCGSLDSTQTDLPDETGPIEIGYHDSPIHSLCLSHDESKLASASIKKNSKGEHMLTVAIWDDIQNALSLTTSSQRPQRSPISQITTLNSHKTLHTFAADGSLSIWDRSDLRKPLKRIKFKEVEAIDSGPKLRYFISGDAELVIRARGVLLLYQIPAASDEIHEIEGIRFDAYDQARPDYEPLSVARTSSHGYIFGCRDGRIIHRHGPDSKVIPFQAVKSGSVEFMTRLNDDDGRLLCWSSLPSNDEVFIICTKQEDDFRVTPFSISLDNRIHRTNIHRPLRIWDRLNLIAVTHSDYTITIWLWDEITGELTLQAELKGHSGFVTDIERLDNDIYVTSSEDKTIRAWKYNKKLNSFSPYKKFMGDYSFTKLLLLSDDNSDQIVAGDEMGILHLIKC